MGVVEIFSRLSPGFSFFFLSGRQLGIGSNAFSIGPLHPKTTYKPIDTQLSSTKSKV